MPLLLGAALTLSACGDGAGDEAATARVVERILRLGQEPGTEVQAYVKGLPEGLPEGLPRYPRSDLIASFVIQSADQDGYFVIYDSSDAPDAVLRYFEEALDEGPWQVLGSTSSEDLVALQFDRVDDAGVSGGVAIETSPAGTSSSILLSVQVILEGPRGEEEPFTLGESRALPSNFPAEVPIYSDSTVIDTTWLRSPGSTDFAVTFLTEDSQDEVVEFYSSEFTGLGWDVVDEGSQGFAVAISFSDGEVRGSLVADLFAEDDRYTQVDLQVQVGQGPSQGN